MIAKGRDAERLLEAPPADLRVWLLHGNNRGGVRERSDKLAAGWVERADDPFDTALLTESDLADDPARLSDELAALSMLGGRRLVRLRLTEGRIGPERTAAEAVTAHAEGRLNPDALFVIEAGALAGGSPLRKAAESAKAGAVAIAVYDDETGDVARMIKEALARERLRLTPEALELLAARLPKERGVARQEIERLTLYLGPGSGATATPEELEPFLGVEPDASLFDAASDAFGGRLGPALVGLRRAFAEGEDGVSAVRAAGQHLAKLRRIDVLTHAGTSPQVALKQAGVFWKQEREVGRQTRAWTGAALDEAQGEVLAADLACKTAGAPVVLLAERLYLGLAGRARRMGL